MTLALSIIAAIGMGALNGILIAEAMYGRWPWDVVNDGIERIGRWLRGESLIDQKMRELGQRISR